MDAFFVTCMDVSGVLLISWPVICLLWDQKCFVQGWRVDLVGRRVIKKKKKMSGALKNKYVFYSG